MGLLKKLFGTRHRTICKHSQDDASRALKRINDRLKSICCRLNIDVNVLSNGTKKHEANGKA